MAINKNFPNYRKTVIIHTRVSGGEPGMNRSERRRAVGRANKGTLLNIKMMGAAFLEEKRIGREKRMLRRVHRATTRRQEREAALLRGEPVVYSIA